ncbi:hypothetical protein V1283_004764 [Bradyrhizobium sp. AZCC 2262]|uniref:hypothetical protein n=1 Tax=Bradyrhizobium sp. AZCC 2262 TaxID=3117022 RepID=UPI002FEE8EC3
MRVFIAISIVLASVSSASAQFAMDHGHAADAARAAQAAADAKAAAAAAPGAPLLPSQQTNFYVGGGGTVKIVSRTAEELKADEAAQAAWSARCRPTVIEDRDGLRRVKYAERDCDLSRFNTAGN